MLAKVLLTGLTILATATPTLSDQFYIVQDPTTHECSIAERPPAEGAGAVVGEGAYGDRNSAETDMKTIHICIARTADSATRAQDGASPASR